jgi:pimeloyl-ACP methyl ester carboxylesterase
MTNGLLLIHAFPLDARMWEHQLAAFSDAMPVAAPHLPGFGGTPGEGVMTMRSAAERCLVELDRAGIDRAVVCGLSMGGYVALELWRRAPQRFAGLALANTKSGADTDEAAAGRRALAERLGAEGNAFLVAAPPPLLSQGADPALWDRVKGLLADQPAEAIAAAALGMAERPDSTPDLAGISVPASVIVSTGDTLIPAEVTAPMADAIPGAQLITIEGAGHLSNLEAPGPFDDALRELVSRAEHKG